METDTFGSFLKDVIESRYLSVSKFAEMTNNKSKTAVIRLLKDECSRQTILKFAEKLNKTLELTDDEQKRMNSILNKETRSHAEQNAMKCLMSLIDGREEKYKKCSCNSYYPENKADNIPSLKDIFSICTENDSTVIIKNYISKELIYILNEMIHKIVKKRYAFSISYFFKTGEGIEEYGKQLFAIMKLSTYLDYNAYECKRGSITDKRIIILTKKDSKINMRMIEFNSSEQFDYIDTEINEIIYNYILNKNQQLIENAATLRSEPLKKDSLLEMFEHLKKYDTMPSFQINSTLSYMAIPFEIQCRLYEQSNYIGLGRHHPYIEKLYTLLESRAKILDESEIPRKMILTVSGLKKFLKNGKTGDHFAPFDRLTSDECKITLNRATEKNGVRYKLLKDDYSIHDTEFVIYGNECVVIYDPIWGWWEGCTIATVTNKRMIKLVTDFYCEELWKKCCYSEDESKKIVKKLIDETAK